MNQFMHLIDTLETHIDRIRTDLGGDWPAFADQVQSLAPAFETAQDKASLARAVGDLYMACRAREPVMAILRQTADTSGVGHDRRPSAGGTGFGDEMTVRETVNRFQSLLARLEQIEEPAEGQAPERRTLRQSGVENTHDRRTHP